MFDVGIILDCDIASALAKIDRISLLSELFGDKQIVIPEAVYVELLEAEKLGFTFPGKVFDSRIEIIAMNGGNLLILKTLQKTRKSIMERLKRLLLPEIGTGFS